MSAASPPALPLPGNASTFSDSSFRFQYWSRLRTIPRLLATSLRDLPSWTKRTASRLNSGVNERRTRVGPFFFGMDHLVGLSRPYLGVHFAGQLQTINNSVQLTLVAVWRHTWVTGSRPVSAVAGR
jgi:hypothetical protein